MFYHEFKDIKENQNKIINDLSDRLNLFPTSCNGLVDEKTRLSKQYKELNNEFQKEFKKLQIINRTGNRFFKREMRQDRQNKR